MEQNHPGGRNNKEITKGNNSGHRTPKKEVRSHGCKHQQQNTRDTQMAKGKGKSMTNRNQGNVAPSDPSSPTTASPEYPNIPEKQDFDLKSQLMMLMEGFKKDINNSLKELQKNMGKQGEALKELQESTNKQVKELNKTIQDLKMEVETTKKSQRETTPEIENLGKRAGVIEASINNRIQ